MQKKLLLGALLICSMTTLASEEFFFEDDIATTRLEESVITTESFETTVRNTPKNITIITKKDIEEKGAKDLGEVLEGVPGVNVSRLSGSDVTFDLRGQGATAKSNVKVLLDGIPLNSIDLSGYKTSNIPVDTIEKIEVIPSGGSVIYGDGAIGGVINIITTTPKVGQTTGSIGFEAGSDNPLDYNLALSTSATDKLLVNVNYTNNSSDGYRDFSENSLEAFDGSFKYLISDTQNLTLKYSRSDNNFDAPGSLTRQQVEEGRKDSLGYYILGENLVEETSLKYNNKISDRLSINLNSSFREQEYDSVTHNGSFPYSSEYAYNTYAFYIKPQVKYTYGDESYIILGLDYDDAATDVTKSYKPGKREKDSFGGYIFNKYTLNKLELSGGYRYQETEYNVIGAENKFYNDAFELASNYLYSDTGNIYLSFSRAFRTPNTDELGLWEGEFSPQESDTIELGIKEYINTTYLSASIFKTTTTDEIVYAKLDGQNSSNTNLDGKTERIGLEVFAETTFNKLTLTEGFTYLDHEITEGTYEGKKIPGVASVIYSIDAKYDFTNKLASNITFIYTGESQAYADFENTAEEVNSHIIIDTRISYDFLNGFKIYGGIDNIFNEMYYDYVGYDTWNGSSDNKAYYPAPERRFYGGFKYNF